MHTQIPLMQAEIATLKTEMRSLKWWVIGGVLANLIIKLFVPHATTAAHTPAAQNQSVKIGDTSAITPARDYQTTAEFAAANGISERLVIQHIADNRLDPPPTKSGRAWAISADCRILPQSAAISRN